MRAKPLILQSCASCHGPNIDDGEFAPSLKGAAFRQKYASQPVSALIGYISGKMPPGNPGSLGAVTYTQIAAFLPHQRTYLGADGPKTHA
jgi:mono/diheme cytochrome c family protein